MNFPFNLPKAIQSAGLLLSEFDGHCMEHIRLLKLLYIAERKSVQETAMPMIGSQLVAMRNGPLHSQVYDLIKDQTPDAPKWRKYFQQQGRHIHRVKDPGVGSLSRRDVRILKDVLNEFRDIDTWEIVELTHDFEEWQQAFNRIPDSSSTPITPCDLFKALGLSKDELLAYEDQARELGHFLQAS